MTFFSDTDILISVASRVNKRCGEHAVKIVIFEGRELTLWNAMLIALE